MTEVQTLELKRLGVPFFGLRPDLLLADNEVDDGDGSTANGQPKINRKQLLQLQRKMLTHLEEMYGD